MDKDHRERLIRENMALVNFVVGNLKPYLPMDMTMEDAVQEGYVGLVQAAGLYSREKGSFSTYACLRIRGSILDAVCRYHWFYKRGPRAEACNRYTPELMPDQAIRQRMLREREEKSVLLMEKIEDYQQLDKSLSQLAPPEKELIIRHYFLDESLSGIARSTGAHYSFIRRLPEGYQTVISEDGGNISKGQKQMLTIARAMLYDAHMLILDEATSNVDTGTERQIQAAMRRLMQGKTCFVIAHRLSTIRHADCILVVRQGDVVEQGTHEELMKAKGFYHQLYAAQFE